MFWRHLPDAGEVPLYIQLGVTAGDKETLTLLCGCLQQRKEWKVHTQTDAEQTQTPTRARTIDHP